MVKTNHKKYIQILGIKLTFEGNIQSVVLKKTLESISLGKTKLMKKRMRKNWRIWRVIEEKLKRYNIKGMTQDPRR
ncbi:MAG: hypothetical protein ACRC28_07985 [Clostridium sp.]